MTSRFQPIDLAKECRIYFRFVTEDGKPFNAYYNRPRCFCDTALKGEAAANAEQMQMLFHLKTLLQIRIARTQRQIQLAEQEIIPLQ